MLPSCSRSDVFGVDGVQVGTLTLELATQTAKRRRKRNRYGLRRKMYVRSEYMILYIVGVAHGRLLVA